MQVQNNTKFRNSKDRDGEGGKFMRALPGADIQKADHRGKFRAQSYRTELS